MSARAASRWPMRKRTPNDAGTTAYSRSSAARTGRFGLSFFVQEICRTLRVKIAVRALYICKFHAIMGNYKEKKKTDVFEKYHTERETPPEEGYTAMKQKNNSAALCGNNRHVVLFGKVGSGKTSIFNQLIEHAAVTGSSEHNPVVGICKLGKAGSVVLIDTADLNSTTELGAEYMRRTHNIIRRADIAIYVTDILDFDREAYTRDRNWLERNMVPYLLAFNRCDVAYAGDIARLKTEFPEAIFISSTTPGSTSLLRARLAQMVRALNTQEAPLIPDGLVKPGDYVMLLMARSGGGPVRNEHEMLTELLRRGARCVVVDEKDLKKTLDELPRVDLIIAYARSFGMVRDIVPKDIPLTSYSLLYGRQTGELETFIEGTDALGSLNENSHVLIAEGCMHSNMHRDIGRVKIPRALRKLAGEELSIDYSFGPDLPDDIEKYDLVVHCSGCSMTQRAVQARVAICRDAGVPIVNYGTILAALSGILGRCTDALREKKPQE